MKFSFLRFSQKSQKHRYDTLAKTPRIYCQQILASRLHSIAGLQDIHFKAAYVTCRWRKLQFHRLTMCLPKVLGFTIRCRWLGHAADYAELCNATPSSFFLVSHPRIAPANHAHVVGGGTAFLLRDSAVIVKSPPCPTFKTFELTSVTLKLLHSSKLTIFNVYRPPRATTKTRKSMPFSLFLSKLNTLFLLWPPLLMSYSSLLAILTFTLIIPMTL